MAKLTKRVVEGFAADGNGDSSMLWDQELKGFGVRAYESGAKKFILQYRTHSGRQRRMTLGAFGPLTVERAREIARRHLGQVAEGNDPADERHNQKAALTVSQLCDNYMDAALKGLVLGRGGTAKKPSTLETDRGRIERHIKPLIGMRKVHDVDRPAIEELKNSIASGRTAANVKTKKHGRAIVRGGKGTATRTLGLLGAIFQWGVAQGIVQDNPARGVRRFADKQRKALLSPDQYAHLGRTLRELENERTPSGHPTHNHLGLACIRLIALTGLRRGEAVGLRWDEVDIQSQTLRLGDTKTGESFRPLPASAADLLRSMDRLSEYVFPAANLDQPYSGVPKLWRMVRHYPLSEGRLIDVTLHSLRHSYAGVSEELGASIPTIAAFLGHRLGGVTAGYVMKKIDRALIASADRVSREIASMMEPNEKARIIAFPAA